MKRAQPGGATRYLFILANTIWHKYSILTNVSIRVSLKPIERCQKVVGKWLGGLEDWSCMRTLVLRRFRVKHLVLQESQIVDRSPFEIDSDRSRHAKDLKWPQNRVMGLAKSRSRLAFERQVLVCLYFHVLLLTCFRQFCFYDGEKRMSETCDTSYMYMFEFARESLQEYNWGRDGTTKPKFPISRMGAVVGGAGGLRSKIRCERASMKGRQLHIYIYIYIQM